MSSQPSQSKPLTAEELFDLQLPSNIGVSPDGTQLTYSVKPYGRRDEHDRSSIWLAGFGQEKSARQLTSGSFNDRSPEWSPDSKSLAFISDREEAGKKCALYVLSTSGGEAYPVTDASYEAGISAIAWSPNGQFIAFMSPDEKSEERKKKDEAKDDVKVYGEEWPFNRLRVLHVATRETTTLLKEDAHVTSFSWSPDSKKLVAVTTQTPEIESGIDKGSRFEILSLGGKSKETLLKFPGAVYTTPVWSDEKLVFAAGVKPNMISTAPAVYTVPLDSDKYEILGHGREDSVQDIRGSTGVTTVLLASDMDDEITVVDGKSLHKAEQSISSYDAVKGEDGNILLGFATSTVFSPVEVFSKSSPDAKPIQLSDHGHAIRAKLGGTYKAVRCKSFDGKVDLDAVWAAPTSMESSGPLPAMIHIHGGPNFRVTNSWDLTGYRWAPWVMSKNKYGFLSVNYRGGSGRGDEFCAYAAGGMGTVEYDDVLALVEEAIRQGLVDKENLVVAGWSQGGFLSYLAAVRNGATKLPNGDPRTWKFKGAICGAGVTDWDMMSMSSDVPAFESELGGGTPWSAKDKHWTGARQGSAIWEFAAAHETIPPILILHGERDKRVPVTQAVAFHRGCLKFGIPCEMAVYPREPHGFKERAHVVDLLKRVARFLDTHLA